MSSAAGADERVQEVKFSAGAVSVSLRDGRIITAPLAWFPRLLNATPSQRNNWKIAGAGYGVHWPDVDEDLSTDGLLRGVAAPNARAFSSPGHLDAAYLPTGQSWLPIGAARPVQSSALDAANIDDAQQTA